jgi:hypothetical protein
MNTGPRRGRVDDIAQHDPVAVGIGDGQIENFPQRSVFRIFQLHQDGVLVAPFAKGARRGAGQGRLEHGGDLGHGQFHIGCLGPVDQDQLFRGADLPADAGVGDPAPRRDDLLHFVRQGGRGFKIMAAHIHLDAFIALTHAQDKEALTRPRANPDARQAAQFLSQVLGDLFARTVAPADRNQRDAHFSGIAAARPPGGPADERDRVLDFRHRIVDDGFDLANVSSTTSSRVPTAISA